MRKISFAALVLVIATFLCGIIPCRAQDPATRQSATQRNPITSWPDLTKELEDLNRNLPKTPEERKIYEKRMATLHQEMMVRFQAAGIADFRIKGEVVDDEGHRLEDVKLTIERTRQIPIELFRKPPKDDAEVEKYIHTEEITSSGTLDIQAKDCHSVKIYASKKGYQGASEYCDALSSRDYSKEEKQNLLEGNGKPLEPFRVEKTVKLILVLEMPEAKLNEGHAKYIIKPNGAVTFLDLSKPIKKEEIVQNVVGKIPEPSDIPANQMWLSASINNNTGKYETVKCKVGGYPAYVLKSHTLHISGKDAGFVLFEPKKIPASTWRQMHIAPRDGYKNELVLSPETMIRQEELNGVDQGRGVYFFLKTADGKYAKGRMDCSWIWAEEERVKNLEVLIELRIQPDGSRRFVAVP